MKKILSIAVLLCIAVSTNVFAMDLVDIGYDKEFIRGIDTESDMEYLREIANSYLGKYVVQEVNYADISDIDTFYEELSSPLSLHEIDSGKAELREEIISEKALFKNIYLFNLLGGLSGIHAEFEPIMYINIYRNITLVGGYSIYKKNFQEADDAYWSAICNIENETKEIVDYDTRIRIRDNVRRLYAYTDGDKAFKIFILKDGKINSLWERIGES